MASEVPRDPNTTEEMRRFLDKLARAKSIFTNVTATEATALLDVFTSALKGLAPASGGGTANFLRADVSWAVPPTDITLPSACKVWGYVTVSAGAPTLAASYNVTSITDTGVGVLDVTIATDFSSVNWSNVATVNDGVATPLLPGTGSGVRGAGSDRITARTSAGVLTDPGSYSFSGFGAQ